LKKIKRFKVETMNSQQTNPPQSFTITVVIPTYKRARMLPHLLSALNRQTYRNFDVVVVVKPSGDGTEEILNQAAQTLKLKAVIQTSGYIVDAYFLGVKHSTGDIVAFLDDDALPSDDWLQETVKIFEEGNVSAVSGDAFSVFLSDNGEMQLIPEDEIPCVLSPYEFALFGRPLHGLEDYKNCIANSGVVYERGNNAYWRKRGATKALLRGPSMAIAGDVLRNIDMPGEWVLGCAWEMVLGWQLWKRNLTLIFSPNVKVYHVVHGRTSSRDFLNPRTDLLWAVEAELLFYRLYHSEPQFSFSRKVESDIVRIFHSLKYLRSNPGYHLRKIEGIIIGNIVGIKWLLYRRFGLSYSPLMDLERFNPKKE
jgi:glycosyltransferase involved in cell wall biosynthesis